jgi:hypothetical protein
LLATVFDRVRRVWRDKVAGPTLRTYDAACDELGGAPWRQLPEATDRWFLADRPKSLVGRGTPSQLVAMDTGSFDLRRGFSDRTKLALLAGAALSAIVVVVLGLSAGSTSAKRAPIVTAPTIVAPVAQPVVQAVAQPIAQPAAQAAAQSVAQPARGFAVTKRHFAHRRRR